MPFETYVSQLFVGHFDFCRVSVGVKGCFHDQSGSRRRIGDQIHNDFKALQGTGTPVLGDEAEEAMLNLVPFAGAGWEMTDEQRDPQLIRQLLQ